MQTAEKGFPSGGSLCICRKTGFSTGKGLQPAAAHVAFLRSKKDQVMRKKARTFAG